MLLAIGLALSGIGITGYSIYEMVNIASTLLK